MMKTLPVLLALLLGLAVGPVVTYAKIAANSITSGQIAANSITADRLDVSQLSAITADLGSITGGSIDINSGTFVVTSSGAVTINSGELSIGGTRHRLGGIEKTRKVKVAEEPNRARFVLPGTDVTVSGEVGADKADMVGWIYSDPDGGRHDAVNCSVASMTLKVERAGESPLTLTTNGGAVYELGMRERDHGIALQPFPDP